MRWKQIVEAKTVEQPKHIQEALWWVIRYVSGSLNDEDWDWGSPTNLDINSAMEVAAPYIGNKKSVGRPLSRYLLLNKNDAQKLVKTKMLPPHQHGFQSFTTAGVKDAIEIGREINFHNQKGMVEVVVTIEPKPSDVLFGVEDVAACRKPGVGDLHMQWGDWEHQGEVFVRVGTPMPCRVKVLKRGEIDEDAEPVAFRFTQEITKDEKGRMIGEFDAYDGETYAGGMKIGPARDGRGYSVMTVFVNQQYRRMKLATRLYNAAHKAGFEPLRPDSNLKPDGERFWAGHMRNKVKLGQPLPPTEWTPVELDEASRSSFERKSKPARLPDTPENIAAAKAFVLKKWQERAAERGGPNASVPDDLSYSCKFSSLFAREVFGGKLEGNYDHQYVRADDGQIIDLNIDAADVGALGANAHKHDSVFWGSPDHRQSVKSCQPRVAEWVAEFLG